MQTNTLFFHRALLTLSAVFSLLILAAQEKNTHIWPVKLQKDYSKTYPVGSDKVAVMNRYGKMVIETWDRNEVKVEARISVGAQTNEYATKLLEQINVVDEKKTGVIEFKTEMAINGMGDNGGHEFRVDYTVHLPANAKLYAENNYGPLTIGDYTGEAELLCKYGTLTAGKLSNALSVTTEYGKAVIESISDSKLLFRYSKVEINKLAGTIKGEFQYCSSVDLPIDNSVKQLELKNHHTSLYLVTPKDFAADYDIVTSNARVTGKGDIVIKEDISQTVTTNNGRAMVSQPNHHYTGSLGKGGGAQINIKSNYGNIRVM